MTDGLHEICAELDKIATSSYSVSLKNLHTLLIQHGSTYVHQWAAQSPHLIYRLAAEVVDGLQLWSYMPDLIEILTTVESIRDAIFRASPTLLNYFLERATSSKEGLEKHANLCVVLLSNALPANVPLPAAAQTLLLQVFDKAVGTPSAQTVRPVYLLLNGACAGLPSILSQDTIKGFQNHLTQMMRTVKTLEEQSLSLYCLAVIAQITRDEPHEADRGSHIGSGSYAARETTFVSFLGTKAHKTIHLLLLQVLFSCRNGESSSGESALTRIQLAREALAAIDQSILIDWTLANGQLVRKLHEKLLLSDLPSDIHLELYAFAITLCPAVPLGSSAVLRLEKLLLVTKYPVVSARALKTVLAIILPSALPHISELFYQDLLVSCIGHLIQPSHVLITGDEYLSILATSMRNSFRNDRKSQETLLKMLATTEVSELFSSWLRVYDENVTTNAGGVASRSHPVRVLESQISLLIMEAGLGVNLESNNGPCSIFLSLLESMMKKNLRTHRNQLEITSNSLCILEELCTPEEEGASHRWRDKLAVDLGKEAKTRQEIIQRLVGQLCQDFEARCNNVEEPLRQEQMKHEKLLQDHDSLKQSHQTFERRLVAQEEQNEELERKLALLQTELASAHRDLEDVTEQKDTIQEAFDRAQSDAARILAATRRDLETQKLDLRTTVACNVEKIDDQEAEITSLRRKIDSINIASEAQLEEAIQFRAAIEDSLQEAEAKLALEEKDNDRKTQDIQRLKTLEVSLVDELNALKQQLSNNAAEISELSCSHAGACKAWEEEKNSMQFQFEQQINKQAIESHRIQKESENIISAREKEMSSIQDRCQKDLKDKERTIQTLRRKVQKFKEEVAHKTSELEEAQKLKTRLLTAMGLQNSETTLPLGFGLPQAEESQWLTSHKAGRRKPSTTKIEPAEDFGESFPEDSDIEASQPSSASSVASCVSPSPKRAKPRTVHTSYKMPTMHQRGLGNLQAYGLSRKRFSTNREPLADVKSNVQLLKPVVGGKLDSRRASIFPFGRHTKDHDVIEDEPLSTIPDGFEKSRHASPVKGGYSELRKEMPSTDADGYDGLNTADFDCTTVDLENIG